MQTREALVIDSVTDLVLLVLREGEKRGSSQLSGTTRMQKLLFLISRSPEYQDLVLEKQAPPLQFRPYRMGPFTPDIYDAIDALATFKRPLILTKPGSGWQQESVELDKYVDEVDLDRSEPAAASDPRPTVYALTDDGRKVADYLTDHAPKQLRVVLGRVVSEYGKLGLSELLRRVYSQFPEMTERSEIRGQLGLD